MSFVGIILISTVLIKICTWRMVFILMLLGSISCIVVIAAPSLKPPVFIGTRDSFLLVLWDNLV